MFIIRPVGCSSY